MKKTLIPGLLLIGLGLLAYTQKETTPLATRPNVLVIMADDLGYSDLGCYGGEIRTPHLDSLATHGVRFRRFYNAARCCPSSAAFQREHGGR